MSLLIDDDGDILQNVEWRYTHYILENGYIFIPQSANKLSFTIDVKEEKRWCSVVFRSVEESNSPQQRHENDQKKANERAKSRRNST